MGKINSFRIFVADWFIKNNATKTMIEAFKMADDLWDKAVNGDKKARLQIGKLARMYQHS